MYNATVLEGNSGPGVLTFPLDDRKSYKERTLKISEAPLRSWTAIVIVGLLVPAAWSQLTSLDRGRAEAILQDVASDVRKHYYDPKFHGLDWDGRVAETKNRIAKATSWDTAMLEIAALTNDLNDSHTSFVPARTPLLVDYGWQFRMVGDHCYVTHVRPNSDAEAKGLKQGDQVLTLDGFGPSRASMPKINYAINVLSPQASLHVGLQDRSGRIHPVEVMAKVMQPRIVNTLENPYGVDGQFFRLGWENWARRMRPRLSDLGAQAMVVKLPAFFLSEGEVKEIAGKAGKHNALIIDLRDNPGGATETLQYLLGSVFDHEVKIADQVMRSKTTALTTKNGHHRVFNGKLIVLVDSNSSSASELFARAVQIEKRGIVLGDRTSGLVMESRYHPHETGMPPVNYGVTITEADLIMTDGKSLEHTGVTPDETILPTPADLADGRDPVLARAAELAGVKLTPEAAGKLLPYEWPAD
jgi:C-terminal processing protease CtpA/Prc